MDRIFSVAASEILRRTVLDGVDTPGVAATTTDRVGSTYQKALGVRHRNSQIPVTTEDVLGLTDLVPALYAIAALQLFEDGVLDLDAPVRTYVPAVGTLHPTDVIDIHHVDATSFPRTEVTTLALLTHTVGYGCHCHKGPTSRAETALLPTTVGDSRIQQDAQTRTELIGRIVEAVTNRHFEEIVRRRIVDPLGSNTLRWEATKPALIDAPLGACSSVQESDCNQRRIEPASSRQESFYGTIGDIATVIRMWLNDGRGRGGRVLRSTTVLLAERSRIAIGPTAAPPRESHTPAPPRQRPPASDDRTSKILYWVDRKRGHGGAWATRLDAGPESVRGFVDFRSAHYGAARLNEQMHRKKLADLYM